MSSVILSANPMHSTFKTCIKSDHFLYPPLLPLSSKPSTLPVSLLLPRPLHCVRCRAARVKFPNAVTGHHAFLPHSEFSTDFPSQSRKQIHTMEYYSAIKKNSFESVLRRWMKREPIIQSEVSQKDKDHYNILTHIYGI